MALAPLSEMGKKILDELVWQYGDQLGVELTYERIDPEEREERIREVEEERQKFLAERAKAEEEHEKYLAEMAKIKEEHEKILAERAKAREEKQSGAWQRRSGR